MNLSISELQHAQRYTAVLIGHNEGVNSSTNAGALTRSIINQLSEAKWSGQRVLISRKKNKSYCYKSKVKRSLPHFLSFFPSDFLPLLSLVPFSLSSAISLFPPRTLSFNLSAFHQWLAKMINEFHSRVQYLYL